MPAVATEDVVRHLPLQGGCQFVTDIPLEWNMSLRSVAAVGFNFDILKTLVLRHE